ncbi:MAG: hypothetical protein JHC70_22230 [Rhodococcus sp.]|nr:hypothetical protein [Rhodococcus sp. (in: high G+C Gram-positive bacteria)]MBJ7325043.1 hypothetical protein [Rhodococcus sp. (in: high G+C Gram-positive bacteria)]
MSTDTGVSVGELSDDEEGSRRQGGAERSATQSVDSAAVAVRDAAARACLDEPVLRAILHEQNVQSLDEVLAYCFSRSADVPKRRQMARLVNALQDAEIDIRIRPGLLDNDSLRMGRWIRDGFAGGVFAGSAWLVLGGVLTGQNELAQHTSILFTLSLLVICLTVLALLEAAHIGAVALSAADISQLRSTHPRVFKLHRHIATKARLEHFLAGRQCGVVIIVFGIAEVTRTAGMTTVPGLGIPIPAWFDIALQIGVPGALMVLVLGQVAPQLIAARAPAAMLNTWPMSAAFTATRYISKAGLATPAVWLMSGLQLQERIPSAAKQRFTDETVDVTGLGVDTVAHTTTIDGDRASLLSTASTIFTQDGSTSYTATIASTPTAPYSFGRLAHMYRGGDSLPVVLSGDDKRSHPDGGMVFTETLSPRVGVFEAGDLLHTSFQAELKGLVTRDIIVVSAPTRRVVSRVVLKAPPGPTPPARLSITTGVESRTNDVVLVPATYSEDGNDVEFVAVIRYPAVGSTITLEWS